MSEKDEKDGAIDGAGDPAASEAREKPARSKQKQKNQPSPESLRREMRLKEQLRVNLMRRKQQARARRAGEEDARPGALLAGEPSPGESDEGER